MSDYQQGESDSQSGIPAREDASDDYIEGYGCVYECDAKHADMMDNFNEAQSCL